MKITQKNTKNLLLTILACLNCVHTTHAVESTSNKDTINKLCAHRSFQMRREYYARKENDQDVARDALAQVAETTRKIVKLTKDDLNPNSPNWRVAEKLEQGMGSIRDHIQSLTNMNLEKSLLGFLGHMIEGKIKKLVKQGQIPGVDVDSVHHNRKKYPYQGYKSALCKAYPDLDQCFNRSVTLPEYTSLAFLLGGEALEHATYSDNQMNKLADLYPDTATAILDMEKNKWRSEIIGYIKADDSYMVSNLRQGIERLGESTTKLAQEVTRTVLGTMFNIIAGDDQDLKEKTEELLELDPDLRAMVLNYEALSNMPLAKTMQKKETEDA